jgi:hypothetical protein
MPGNSQSEQIARKHFFREFEPSLRHERKFARQASPIYRLEVASWRYAAAGWMADAHFWIATLRAILPP